MLRVLNTKSPIIQSRQTNTNYLQLNISKSIRLSGRISVSLFKRYNCIRQTMRTWCGCCCCCCCCLIVMWCDDLRHYPLAPPHHPPHASLSPITMRCASCSCCGDARIPRHRASRHKHVRGLISRAHEHSSIIPISIGESERVERAREFQTHACSCKYIWNHILTQTNLPHSFESIPIPIRLI